MALALSLAAVGPGDVTESGQEAVLAPVAIDGPASSAAESHAESPTESAEVTPHADASWLRLPSLIFRAITAARKAREAMPENDRPEPPVPSDASGAGQDPPPTDKGIGRRHFWGNLPDPFLDAQWFPADTRGFIAIHDLEGAINDLRREGTLEIGLEESYARSEVGRAWRGLADRFGMTDAELLRDIFGRRVVIALPAAPTNSGDHPVDAERTEQPSEDADSETLDWFAGDRWVIVAETRPEVLQHLVARMELRVVVREGVDSPIYGTPDGRLFAAWANNSLLLAGAEARSWMLPLMTQVAPSPSLADAPDFREARLLGRGHAAVFFRGQDATAATDSDHSKPLWWAAGAHYVKRHEFALIRTLGRYTEEHVADLGTGVPLSAGVLREHFGDMSIVVSGVNRFTTDATGTDPVGRAVRSLVRSNADLLPYLGPTTLTLVLDRPHDEADSIAEASMPADLVWAIEVRPEDGAHAGELEGHLDLMLLNALQGAQMMTGSRFTLALPDLLDTAGDEGPAWRGAVRQVDLGPMFVGLGLDEWLPGGGAMHLGWSLQTDRSRQDRWWWFVGTSPEAVEAATAFVFPPEASSGEDSGHGSVPGGELKRGFNSGRDRWRGFSKPDPGLLAQGMMRSDDASAILRAFPGVDASDTVDSMHGGMYTLASAMRALKRVHWKIRVTSPVSIEGEYVLVFNTPDEIRSAPSDASRPVEVAPTSRRP